MIGSREFRQPFHQLIFDFAFAVAALMLFGNASARAEVLFQHNGNANPLTEGWTPIGPLAPGSGGITTGPVTNDLGLGINAWSTDDNSTQDGSYVQYTATVAPTQLNNANTNGWRLTTTLRIVDIPDTADFSIYAQYINGTRAYSMVFGSEADGDPIITLVSDNDITPAPGAQFTFDGAGSGYHSYELVFDPLSAAASLYVDGIERLSNYTGYDDVGTIVGWGAGGSASLGQGNFAFVQFEVSAVPEPGSIVLSIMTACALAMHWRRTSRGRRAPLPT